MNPTGALHLVASEAGRLASALPCSLLHTLADSILTCNPIDWAWYKTRIVGEVSQPHYRGLVAGFLDTWESQAKTVTPEAVAATLVMAANSEDHHRQHQSLELVWTGPDIGVVPLRRTEQALLQVIDSACHRATVVSYAVYNIPRICEALVRAADRGVTISIIIETPDRLEGQNTYDTLKALGPSVAARCAVFLWPLEKREKDENGKPGILHVKCAVADGRWLFLSSANLTEYAFTINMELGVLVTGGKLPGQAQEHFDRLIGIGALVAV
jgi:phosphatidylserine/phosphatidylglycerophosphate/cardiolipin synthase-like enzyme